MARSQALHVNVSFSTLLPFHIQKVHPRRGYRNPRLAESNRERSERAWHRVLFQTDTVGPHRGMHHPVQRLHCALSIMWSQLGAINPSFEEIPPFQIYKMVVVGKRDVLVEMSEEWWYWGMRPDVWGISIWFGKQFLILCHVKFHRATFLKLILSKMGIIIVGKAANIVYVCCVLTV